MKSNFFYTGLLMLIFAGCSATQKPENTATQETTNSEQSSDLIQDQILQELLQADDCREGKKIQSRSRNLQFSDRQIQVYIEAAFARSPSSEKGNGHCIDDWRQKTLSARLFKLDKGESSTPVVLGSEPTGGYKIESPQSFSGNGHYLITTILANYGAEGLTSLGIYNILDDLQDITKKIKFCRSSKVIEGEEYQADFIDFKGFTAELEFIVSCDFYGLENNWHEVVNLADQSVQKISNEELEALNDRKSYGTLLSKGEILKTQAFSEK